MTSPNGENPTTSNFVFKDVEESLECFSGEAGKDIVIWLKDFEDIATVCNWNDVQRYLYARRLLKGAARLSIEASVGIHSWKNLKDHLISEFGVSHSSISIHRALERRKKSHNESYLEYFYSMKQIANRGNVDDKSLIAYIVEGIQDEVYNKTVLYEAKDLGDLKDKFKIYETMKSQKSKKAELKQMTGKDKGMDFKRRCANCGGKSHISTYCPHKAKGSRCYNCSEFGHIATNCPNKRSGETSKMPQQSNQVNVISIPDSHVKVNISDQEYIALLDTGSDVSLIKHSLWKRIGTELEGSSIYLTGFGKQMKKTIGSFHTEISINGDLYTIKCHVVPDAWITQDMLIGKDIMKDAKIIFENGKVYVKRLVAQEGEGDSFLEELDVVQLIEDSCSVSLSNIQNQELRKEVEYLISNYTPVRPEKSCIEMKIILENDSPVHQKPRRLAPVEKDIVTKQVQEWLAEGIVTPSTSDFASPVVIVKKKDGTNRVCIDYRKLNNKIMKDRYPLPNMEEILENLYNAYVFSTLDLRNGFFHVDISQESRKYTSFVTHDGQYEFLKAPFGLCNSPSVFQRFINTALQSLIRSKVLLVYLDDIIVPSTTEAENVEKLKLVLEVAKEHGLIIKWEKCKFLRRTVEFLGHIIENGSIKPSQEKILAVRNFPMPKNTKHIQSFLGLTGFFRKFIPNYSMIAKPLSDLIKKSSEFCFGPQQQDAFNHLKELLCSDPVLKLFNPTLETELHTDASQAGYGAVLLQRHVEDKKLHPVFYLSYKTSEAEKKYSSYELEVLAIIKSLKKLRTYLLGLNFKIYTDCKAFQLTMSKKELCTRIARWALLLQEYDCTIHHRSGSTMRHVDALSRYPAVYSIEDSLLHQVRRAQREDNFCQLILTILKDREYEDYVLKNDLLYKFVDGDYLLVIPKSMQQSLIRNTHEQGHVNKRKVENLLRREYYIPDLAKKIEKIISSCVPCILAARKAGRQEGFLNPIEKVEFPLHTYHVDHLGPLPSTAKSYNYLFVVVDAFTKFSWIYPVKAANTDEVIKKLSQQSEVFGDPHRIISDKGTAFTSSAFRDYCEERKINHVLITTGVPRGNGQVERLNQSIISILSKMSVEDPRKWYKFTPRLQKILNSTECRSTGKSPFELMIGVKMRRPEDLQLVKLLHEEQILEFEESRKDVRQLAKRQIRKIQEENRKYYARRRKPATKYNIKDLVAIKRTQFGPGLKLFPKYLGPYEVVKLKGKDRYEVRKVGDHEGPLATSTAADYMKPWAILEEESSSESDDQQDGRMWEQNSSQSLIAVTDQHSEESTDCPTVLTIVG